MAYGIHTDILLRRISNNPTWLYISDLRITSLPTLPNSLEDLFCSDTKITSLPTLPNRLKELHCYNTLITSLPTLPDSLEIMYCHNTKITTLPALPDKLCSLICRNTQLTTLPKLPKSLRYMSCSYYVVPSLLKQYIYNTKICVYNKNNIEIEQTAKENQEAYLKKCYELLLNDNILSKEIKLELIHKVFERM